MFRLQFKLLYLLHFVPYLTCSSYTATLYEETFTVCFMDGWHLNLRLILVCTTRSCFEKMFLVSKPSMVCYLRPGFPARFILSLSFLDFNYILMFYLCYLSLFIPFLERNLPRLVCQKHLIRVWTSYGSVLLCISFNKTGF